MENNKSYVIAVADGSTFYIPEALHIERNDELMLAANDVQASIEAELDGIKLIYGMEGVPDRVYIDTLDNRDIIIKMLNKYPEYKLFGGNIKWKEMQ